MNNQNDIKEPNTKDGMKNFIAKAMELAKPWEKIYSSFADHAMTDEQRQLLDEFQAKIEELNKATGDMLFGILMDLAKEKMSSTPGKIEV